MSEADDRGGEVSVAIADGVATVSISHPQRRNAMTYRMWTDLAALCDRLAGDRSVRLLVVRGTDGHFCAGADISGLRDESVADYQAASQAAEEALATFPKPTIAFVAGACIGGGTQIAVACDLRIADTTATFGITPARLGIVYPQTAVERAVQLLGPAVTKYLLFSASVIDGQRAWELGLVNELHAPEVAERRIGELADLLVHQRSLLSQMAAKAMVDAVARDGFVPPALAASWAAEAAAGSDGVEGIAAFLEHRPPDFTWSGPGG